MSITRLHVGPRLSRMVIHDDTVYLTGCIAEQTKGQSVREQTREILATIDKSLAEAGSDKTKILSAHVYLARITTYAEMNAEWDAWVPEGNTPARATFEAKLPLSGTSVMIVCVAARS
jgi:enamine deaminase RidA (YjgF/YER057c/UK114 family)